MLAALIRKRLPLNFIRFTFSTEPEEKKKDPPSRPVFSSAFRRQKQSQQQQHQSSKVQQQKVQLKKPLSMQERYLKIHQVNKNFLGIKLNTNYLKTYKEVTLASLAKNLSSHSVSDTPFAVSASPSNEIVDDQKELKQAKKVMGRKSTQLMLHHCRFELVEEKMQKIVKQFMEGWVKENRLRMLEPNFEAECIRTKNALISQGFTFKLVNENSMPDVRLTTTSVYFGLSANRNSNYSTDSYQVDQSELIDRGIARYKLVKEKNEPYPQPEWFSTLRLLGRFQAVVRGGPAVQILRGSQQIGSSDKQLHRITFEVDLTIPPLNAGNHLTREQYQMSYRLDHNNILITNIDSKNRYYTLTYSEQIKKDTLINKIIDQ